MPVAGVVEHVDPCAAGSVERVAELTAPGRTSPRRRKRATTVEGPTVGRLKRARRLPEIGVAHDDGVDVLSIHNLERSEQPARELVIDRQVRSPNLWPFEVRGDSVHVERLRPPR